MSDVEAFVRLTGSHRPALHLHCYRILGSLHDADDALQETLLRAWRNIERFEPRATLSAWLYRIATNVCLRMLERRSRDATATVDGHLEPYPDRLLEEPTSSTTPFLPSTAHCNGDAAALRASGARARLRGLTRRSTRRPRRTSWSAFRKRGPT